MVKKYVFNCDNSRHWEQRPGYNYVFLRSRQTYYNDYLAAYGFVPLFKVLEELGFEFKESDLKYVLDDSDGFIDFHLAHQTPKLKGRPKRNFTIYLNVRPINEEEV